MIWQNCSAFQCGCFQKCIYFRMHRTRWMISPKQTWITYKYWEQQIVVLNYCCSTITWSVHVQSCDHCMIATWSVNDQSRDQCVISNVISVWSSTWSVHAQLRDQSIIATWSVLDEAYDQHHWDTSSLHAKSRDQFMISHACVMNNNMIGRNIFFSIFSFFCVWIT